MQWCGLGEEKNIRLFQLKCRHPLFPKIEIHIVLWCTSMGPAGWMKSNAIFGLLGFKQ
jgi:hypothetical protein